MNKRIEINDRVIVVNPPSILPSLLGAKLRVLSVAKEWVEVEVAKRPIRIDMGDVEFAEPGLRKRITRNYPDVFYHGTDLMFASMPEGFRKLYLSYCKYFRETLFPRFYQYYTIGEKDDSRLKSLLGVTAEKTKTIENLKEALHDMACSRTTEEYEYGDFYITTNRLNAVMYAKKAFAGGEFAFSAYALIKAAKAAGLQDWYQNDKLPDLEKIADCIIGIAEAEPHPVIYKLTDIDPEYLRTECNERIEKCIRNGWLSETEFRYSKPIDLSLYEYDVIEMSL